MRKYALTIDKKKIDVEVIDFTKDVATLKVNGKKVTVACNSIQAISDVTPQAAKTNPKRAPASAPRPRPPVASAPSAASSAAPSGGGTTVPAPIPGSIMQVYVKVGDKIKSGTTVVKMEAMKMENEIKSPADGTVSKICVSPGQNVAQGAPLVILT